MEQTWSLWSDLKKKSKEWRLQENRSEYPTLLLTDTQSTKNSDSSGRGLTGYDGGKKVKGIKKSITVDTTGFPPDPDFIQIETANTSEKLMCNNGFTAVQNNDRVLINNRPLAIN